MTPPPLVSIITPSLNQGRFIEETILSVLGQDYPHIEYMVMDGGSTDGTLDILKKYEGRLTYVSEPDQGQSDAINKGWRKARGEIVAWLNSDDTYCPGAILKAVEAFQSYPEAGIVYGDCYGIDTEGRVIRRMRVPGVDLAALLSFTIIRQPAVFLRRTVIETVGLLDPGLHGLMDHDLWIRAAFRFRFHHIRGYLASGREHPQSKNATIGARFAEEAITILEKIFSDREKSEELQGVKTKAYAGAYLNGAFWLCLAGDRHRSRAALLRAMRLNPSLVLYPFRPPLTLPILVESFLGITVIPQLRWIKHRWIGIAERVHRLLKRQRAGR